MNKKVLDFINKCEGWKTAIKSLHWDSNSLSQHELCDKIADNIADFQDKVSEVEQSISGKLSKNKLNPTSYKVSTLKKFVEDILDDTNTFYKSIGGDGDTYIGMRSDCESFLSDMQRDLYLVNFTMKEDLKRRLQSQINESRPKNINNSDNVDKFIGRRPKSIKSRINQIYRIVKKYGIDSRIYHDENWQAISDYYKVISSLGCEVQMKPCGNLNNKDSIESDGGYTDYDQTDNMPRSKQYYVNIIFDDGMNIDGYIKCMAAGTVSDPFSSYDTCMVLWPKQNNVLEDKNMNKQMRLTEAELKQVVKEATMKILSETPLNYDVDNFSGRWTKPKNWNIPNYDLISGEEYIDDEGYLDDPYKNDEIEDALKDDEWEWGKDMDLKGAENDYSWDRFDGKPIAQGLDPYYKVGKGAVGREVDDAIDMRNRQNDWSDKELRNGARMMDKWVSGKRNADDIGDAWDDIHYESRKPMKVINEIGNTPKGRKALARLSGRRMAQGATLGAELKRNGIEGGNDMVTNKFNRSLNAMRYADDALDREIRKALDKFALGEEDEEKIKNIIKNSETKRMHNDYQDEFYGYGESAYRTNESKNLKLSEGELKQIIKEAAMSLIKEYGDTANSRRKMAAAAKRSVMKGDSSVYQNAMNSLNKRRSSKDEMEDFQQSFEE